VKLIQRVQSLVAGSFYRMTDRVADHMVSAPRLGCIAINMRPQASSWGGGNQWVQQMTRALRAEGYSVRFDLAQPVDGILMVDPRPSDQVSFGPDEIRQAKKEQPTPFCLHRINENDQRKQTKIMDTLLAQANTVADHTVFVSEWLRDYHTARWFDRQRPHTAILNGADPRHFYPAQQTSLKTDDVMRLVTHHWSDNWMKGFAVYRQIDELIQAGKLPKTELRVIGRWPKEIKWQTAKTFGPMSGAKLGSALRECHLYVTGSLWDPGPMHPMEGIQSGLPLIYHEDGGGIVEVGRRYGIGFRDDVASAILQARQKYSELRAAVLKEAPSGDRMCAQYVAIIRSLIKSRRP
jgi:glycosyltransferase involved in cell wall biosynthesis